MKTETGAAAGDEGGPMTQRARLGMGGALTLAFGIVGSAWSEGDVTSRVRVFQFQPGALEVRAGDRITWTNEDDITHTVTSGAPGSPDGRFDIQLAGKGTRGSVRFPAPGAYAYFCAQHPSMRGEVLVR